MTPGIKAIIGIQDFSIHCIIGELSYERDTEQAILIDLLIETDATLVSKSDNVKDTINYVDIADACTKVATNGRFRLLEAFANAVLEHLLSHWPISWAKIKVKKPMALPKASYCFVEMERRR